ncbi:MAG: cryptochrome/photolyase family protein [Flavobacterium sp. BFFFF2]|nr:MAG: cryptochrome/photolyase family protein [Flavobacterium sp. BFFFF2]
MPSTPKTLRLILGDQLNIHHSWFSKIDPQVTYVLMEVRSETDYVVHHVQKVLGIFAAMRQFSTAVVQLGHNVTYVSLDDAANQQEIAANCAALIAQDSYTLFEYQYPDEYRLDQHLKQFTQQLTIASNAVDTEHFYTERWELATLFEGKKTYLMETFYRHMRQKNHILVEKDKKPLNGKWNFDADNRQKLPKNHVPTAALCFENNLTELHRMIEKAGVKTIGTVDPAAFIWPINRAQSLDLLDYFLVHCLPVFGSFQDAMASEQWSIYHSRLSFSLNIKLLSPKEVVDRAIAHYWQHTDAIAFHQLEGFVRQIVGWREFVRGIYWLKMPDYAALNFFEHKRPLPDWYWTGQTKMQCLKQSIRQSLHKAYAHHIQRLMVTGNFALLAEVDPDALDAWYLGIYIDAFEWVEMPNTRGMSQFADGGIVGTKPYVSSAAYLHKMSNYCQTCYYDYTKKTGERACPFNSLYWHFYAKNEALLAKNPRIGMMYAVWHKMDQQTQSALLEQAEIYLNQINSL